MEPREGSALDFGKSAASFATPLAYLMYGRANSAGWHVPNTKQLEGLAKSRI